MTKISLDNVRTFLAVAECRSFSAAARQLGITPTAASKAVRMLETQHEVILFQRTTRSVALTEAGHLLFERLQAATVQMDDAFAALSTYHETPRGTLRITAPRALGPVVLRHAVPRFRALYPQVQLDLSLDDGMVDLIAEGFDAGIRLGHAVAAEMVAVRLTDGLAWSVVGSPEYFEQHGRPLTPADLSAHETIRYRFPTSGALHQWEFRGDRGSYRLACNGSLTIDHTGLIADLARAGQGLAYLPDLEIAGDLSSGRLVRVLCDHVAPTAPLYLYFPLRTQQQPKLRAFADVMSQLRDW